MPPTPKGRGLGRRPLRAQVTSSTHQEPCLLHPVPQPQPRKGERPAPAPEPSHPARLAHPAQPSPAPPRGLPCSACSVSSWTLVPIRSAPRPQLPGLFDVGHVVEQLRQAGVLETVRARSAHFPVRVPFRTFLARWGSRMGAAEGTSGVMRPGLGFLPGESGPPLPGALGLASHPSSVHSSVSPCLPSSLSPLAVHCLSTLPCHHEFICSPSTQQHSPVC